MTNALSLIQQRGKYRTVLHPSEMEVSDLWLHVPESSFTAAGSGPVPSALHLGEGIEMRNLSASGGLLHLFAQADTPVLGLAQLSGVREAEVLTNLPSFQDPADPGAPGLSFEQVRQLVGERVNAVPGTVNTAPEESVRGIDLMLKPRMLLSLCLRFSLRGRMNHIVVSGPIIRGALLSATSEISTYELAMQFTQWGIVANNSIGWYRVRDDSVPPVAFWITQRQLNYMQRMR